MNFNVNNIMMAWERKEWIIVKWYKSKRETKKTSAIISHKRQDLREREIERVT